MAKRKHTMEGGRYLVDLRGVDVFMLLDWRQAEKDDPEGTAWARIIVTRERPPFACDLSVSIDAGRYDALCAGLATTREKDVAVRSAIYEQGSTHMEERHMREEVECGLGHADPTVLGPHTLVVEWSLAQAYDVVGAVSLVGEGESDIALGKVGPQVSQSVVVAVSMPTATFDAVMARSLGGGPDRTLADIVYDEVMRACKSRSAKRAVTAEPDDWIPF